MQRRSFIAGLGSAFLLPGLARAAAPLAAEPFGLGIASGRPQPQSVVLWTRLMADNPAERLGAAIKVGWSVAEDERMQKIVRSGEAIAEPQWGHSVHVDVEGLKPRRPYWYRFTVQGKASPIGRTRTAPDPAERLATARFAFASCQMYEHGFYSAHRHMAGEDLDAVLFVGDYIYERSWGREHVRRHETGIPTSIEEFRDRYALYKFDPDLQAVHAAHPWIVTWDDHEVTNDYANDSSPDVRDPGLFLRIRAAAYQAFWEHMPLSNKVKPSGPSFRLYDRYRFGDLAEVFVLDDRQYRSPNACFPESYHNRYLVDCADRLDPARSMLGAEQEAWFADGMKRASARWNLVAQQTLMAQLDSGKDGKHRFWADGWDGYPMARQKLLDAVAASPARDTLVLGGDVHSFWTADLKRDYAAARSPIVATEFVGGSITSQPQADKTSQERASRNPHIRYAKGGVNGYGVVTLDARHAAVTFRTVDKVKERSSPVSDLARFVVEAGRPGAQRA
ncbi:MAG: alkaline phosphatase D family protein [Proteobacteria bacterium]|nr:alkaline phosphatase D family protein [Pseudomonadota bacterium]